MYSLCLYIKKVYSIIYVEMINMKFVSTSINIRIRGVNGSWCPVSKDTFIKNL